MHYLFQRPNLGLYQNGYHKQYRLPAEKQSATERLSVFFEILAAGRWSHTGGWGWGRQAIVSRLYVAAGTASWWRMAFWGRILMELLYQELNSVLLHLIRGRFQNKENSRSGYSRYLIFLCDFHTSCSSSNDAYRGVNTNSNSAQKVWNFLSLYWEILIPYHRIPGWARGSLIRKPEWMSAHPIIHLLPLSLNRPVSNPNIRGSSIVLDCQANRNLSS